MPNPLILDEIVRRALQEDLGLAGDLTSNAVIPPGIRLEARLVARQPGVIAGVEAASLAFRTLDPGAEIRVAVPDGGLADAGATLVDVRGDARALLTAERTALNLLCHLSGVATATRGLVDAVAGTRSRIVCTRKTTPGLRALEKQAVRLGGGHNHRFGLGDGILVKDNHIAAAGGIAPAVERVRAAVGHMVKVEVEVDSLDQLATVLALPVDAVLLDNMPPDLLRRAVAMVDGRMVTEASGTVGPKTVRAVAETGVDIISAGWITHSAPILDIGMDV
ncbi:carboxylating nicotinate-nucleotide diphosphorylase [Azospirillum sp. RWY-5-1]|uniref:nicotinate-nucleotide diphosphorylase (carboxylating) n=1 Tax=Azospirillum oleiclasticum TaxID=2735135 RepID=A0ABX2TAN0_9PROT|nr:carboxylating nicotinate-nucleotide diphosphorylase [Azospirillum oleiclasticum]NYZ13937.1 carboxylating nicotinate-nucleotide diphosphorylase [Azospirillum oleiclasticum]NYZ20860.1 carboxylating nicotinate-nucleotide diphosphorylase [Azospirillum oleiclasticum]